MSFFHPPLSVRKGVADYDKQRSTFQCNPMSRDGWNSFDIVCVCPCVFPLSSPNEQTYKTEFLLIGQVGGYLGQVQMSRS